MHGGSLDNHRPTRINRRGFLKLAGLGGAAAATAGGLRLSGGSTNGGGGAAGVAGSDKVVRFRAVGALPKPPLPSYASQIVEGTVDVAGQSGVITSQFFAGPDAPGAYALPGFGRSIRVTSVVESGPTLHVKGVIEDRAQLQPGESQQVTVRLERARGVALVNVHGRDVELALVP